MRTTVYVIVHDYGLNGAGVEPLGYASAGLAELARPALELENGGYTGYNGATVEPVELELELEPGIAALLRPLLGLATTRELLEELVARLDLAELVAPACTIAAADVALVSTARTALRDLPAALLEYRTVDA